MRVRKCAQGSKRVWGWSICLARGFAITLYGSTLLAGPWDRPCTAAFMRQVRADSAGSYFWGYVWLLCLEPCAVRIGIGICRALCRGGAGVFLGNEAVFQVK